MAIFKPLVVPRTKVAANNPILYENGRGAQGFHNPSSDYFMWEVIPHDNKWTDGSPSFMAPPSHYHLLQAEYFHVASGSGYWYLPGKKVRLKAGDDITIPRWYAHRFESVPNEKKEPLVIWYRYDPQRWEMEERFFRNTLTYLDDCRKIGVAPSILQLSVFLTYAWMPGDFIWCPGGEYVRCVANTLLTWILALVGMLLFGYKGSYLEYYDPAISKRRVEEESRKRK